MLNKDSKTGRFLPSKNFNHNLNENQIIDMYKNGMKAAAIAKKLKTYPKKIQKILKNAGIEFRKKQCYLNGKDNPRFTGYEEMQGAYLTAVKSQAKRRGIEFDISYELLWDIFLKQERKCAYSGIEIFFSRSNLEHINGDATASIDRIDSSIGYVEGNVQWVHKRINIMKGNMSNEEFLDFCEAVTFKNKGQDIQKTFSHSQSKLLFSKGNKNG
jgi:hypothetical protein